MTIKSKRRRGSALCLASLAGIVWASGAGFAETPSPPPLPTAETISQPLPPRSGTAGATSTIDTGKAAAATTTGAARKGPANAPARNDSRGAAQTIVKNAPRKLTSAAPAKLYPLNLRAPEHGAIKQPLDPAAATAFDVLESHCARCHQADLLPSGDKPAGDFGNVLHLQDLADDPHFVQPGNPDGSPLYTSMLKRDMPYDVLHEFKPGARPSVAEIAAIRDWIEGLPRRQSQAAGATRTASTAPPSTDTQSPGSTNCADGARQPDQTRLALAAKTSSKPVTGGSVAARITAYLKSAGSKAPKDLRFASLSHLQRGCRTTRAMTVYRHAVAKLLNLVSRAPQPKTFKSIDAAGTIIAFRLSDLGWTERQWQQIKAHDPYALPPQSSGGTDLITHAASWRHVRGDWLAQAALRAPLYRQLLGQAKTAGALRKALHLSLQTNIQSALVKRIAIQGSAIAKNNRLLERHEIGNGVYWTSYDFSSSKGRQNLAKHPLGPYGKRAFRHKLNTVLYSLPNGFPAFYLNDDEGRQLVAAPRRILRDEGIGTGVIFAAQSCLSCHGNGPVKISRAAKVVKIKTSRLSKAAQAAVEELYVGLDNMNASIASDARSMDAAFRRAGLQQNLTLHGVEGLSALMERYRQPVDLQTAAKELGVRPQDLSQRLTKQSQKFYGLARRLSQGGTAREEFSALFGALSAVVNRATGAKPQVAITGAPRGGGIPDGQGDAGTTPALLGQKKARKPPLRLSLYSNKSLYKRNDSAQFWARTTRDCNLTLINIDTLGRGTVIFPNDFHPDNKLTAGQTLNLPGEGAPYQFRLREIGSERIVGVCNVRAKSADGITHDFEKQKFTNLGNYRAFLDKALAKEWTGYGVVQPRKRKRRRRRRRRKVLPKPKANLIKNKTPLVQARSAIIFDIR